MKHTSWRTLAIGLGVLLLLTWNLGVPAFAQEGTATAAADSAAKPAADLPPAADLVAAYVDAIGGRKAIEQHTSMKATGTFEMPTMGLVGDLSVYAAAPDRLRVQIDVDGMGEIHQGFDGEVGWVDDPMTGPQLITGGALDALVRQADFYPELNYQQLFPEMKTVDKVEFAGHEAYKVRCVDTSGDESFHYFAVDSDLLVGVEGDQETQMGRIFVTTELEGYETFGDRKVATKMTQKMMGMEQIMMISDVEYDGVEATTFALPDSIKTLVEANAAAPE